MYKEVKLHNKLAQYCILRDSDDLCHIELCVCEEGIQQPSISLRKDEAVCLARELLFFASGIGEY
jgi:hypothetical protein